MSLPASIRVTCYVVVAQLQVGVETVDCHIVIGIVQFIVSSQEHTLNVTLSACAPIIVNRDKHKKKKNLSLISFNFCFLSYYFMDAKVRLILWMQRYD